ncbi:phosphoethanolamine transferase [Hydrogenophaga sp. XSHU_21]
MLALWLATVGNLALWRAVYLSPDVQQPGGLWVMATLAVVVSAALVAALTAVLWGPWRRWLGVALLLLSSAAGYFMFTYGIVIDPGMVANVFHTDRLETQGLLSGQLAVALVVGAVLPAVWWWRVPVRAVTPWRQLWQRGATVLVALAVCTGALLVGFQGISSLMRNDKSLRYMFNPFNTVYGLVVQGMGETASAAQPLLPVGLDVRQRVGASVEEKGPLVVLVVGETVRAANFGLGGYPRPTTPRLQALLAEGDLVYFSDTQSCGTSTQVSVPCMFSRYGRAGLGQPREETLVDLVQRAGLGVYWLDNQAGCKGVCDRIPHAYLSSMAPREHCPDGECPDALLLQALPKALAAIDRELDRQGSLVVLHQMGNHGPEYFRRSLPERKAFMPECRSKALASCDPVSIVNAYDNAIRETDALLADTVAWLKQQDRPVALLYVSDHGESLGEKGIFLHGMPWSIAPTEQKQVPMVMWMSPRMHRLQGVQSACLNELSSRPWSHDNLFHTVSGLLQLSGSDVYVAKDLLGPCRHGSPQPT